MCQTPASGGVDDNLIFHTHVVKKVVEGKLIIIFCVNYKYTIPFKLPLVWCENIYAVFFVPCVKSPLSTQNLVPQLRYMHV